ncbi:hypothetical protein CPB86DRAFT_820264 [Serendipita vermifera]|nr:hypothetical protein CPB86DRAFT_820264 [Serendipita vermifera]
MTKNPQDKGKADRKDTMHQGTVVSQNPKTRAQKKAAERIAEMPATPITPTNANNANKDNAQEVPITEHDNLPITPRLADHDQLLAQEESQKSAEEPYTTGDRQSSRSDATTSDADPAEELDPESMQQIRKLRSISTRVNGRLPSAQVAQDPEGNSDEGEDSGSQFQEGSDEEGEDEEDEVDEINDDDEIPKGKRPKHMLSKGGHGQPSTTMVMKEKSKGQAVWGISFPNGKEIETSAPEDLEEVSPSDIAPPADPADFLKWRTDNQELIRKLFERGETLEVDFSQLPQFWPVTAGQPKKEALTKIRQITQIYLGLLNEIGYEYHMSMENILKRSGILKHESRKLNGFNLWAASEKETLRQENGGKPIGGGKETAKELAARWNQLSKEEKDTLTIQLRRDAILKTRDEIKEALTTPQARKKYLENFTKELMAQTENEFKRSRVITMGFTVFPNSEDMQFTGQFFASHDVGMEIWKKYHTSLSTMMKIIASRGVGLNTLDPDVWPDFIPEYGMKLKELKKDDARREVARVLGLVQALTAPWEGDGVEDTGNGRFSWMSIEESCWRNQAALVGWPLDDIWPGSTCKREKKEGLQKSTLKDLTLLECKKILTKFNSDRHTTQRDLFKLQFIKLDELWVTGESLVTPEPSPTEGASKKLTTIAHDLWPVVVDPKGNIIRRICDLEDATTKSRRQRREAFKEAFNDEEREGEEISSGGTSRASEGGGGNGAPEKDAPQRDVLEKDTPKNGAPDKDADADGNAQMAKKRKRKPEDTEAGNVGGKRSKKIRNVGKK